jgi:hypothetical protein
VTKHIPTQRITHLDGSIVNIVTASSKDVTDSARYAFAPTPLTPGVAQPYSSIINIVSGSDGNVTLVRNPQPNHTYTFLTQAIAQP